MRILVWSEAFWPTVGGVELFLAKLTQSLCEHGHHVQVIAAHGGLDLPDEDTFEGIHVDRVDLFRTLQARRPEDHLRLRRRVSGILTRFRPHLLHINLLGPGAMLFAGVDRRTTAKVVAVHAGLDTLRSAREDTVLGQTTGTADWLTACSRTALDCVLRLVPAVAPTSSVIPYGIDVSPSDPSEAIFDPPRLLCVGRLVMMKGFDVAIDAVARLRDSGWSTLRLTIAGDGPERQALEERSRAAGLAASVDFVGWRSPAEVQALMLDASLIVMPSRAAGVEYTEGLGIVALEAAAAGRAVVASRAGGIPDAVVDGLTGLLVAPDAAGSLADAIGELLADPDRAKAMGRAGRARVLEQFQWEGCLQAHQNLFMRLVGDRAARNEAKE